MIDGSSNDIKKAKLLLPGFFLALKKRTSHRISKTVKIPKSVELTMEDVETLLGETRTGLELKRTPKTISISGEPSQVELAAEKVEHFVELAKPPKRTSISEEITAVKKQPSYHSIHECMFCRCEISSRHFRRHCVNTCKVREAKIFSVQERGQIVDEYYSLDSCDFTGSLKNRISEKKCSDSNAELITDDQADSIAKSRSQDEDIRTPIDPLIHNYRNYLVNPMSGKARFEDSTLNNKVRSLERLIDNYGIFFLEELLDKNEIMKLLAKVEEMQVEDTTRYDIALAVKHFLEFCHQEDELPTTMHESIRKALVRWENARSTFQKGLKDHRAKKKKSEIVERELGKYPTVSDVAMCEVYFKKKVPVIKKDTFTENNMRRFYIWIAFYFSSTNALRPSSIGNMKHKEFMNAFKRNELKIVCVEG